MQYTPLWTSILRSPKVFALDPESFRFWAFCLVIAQEHDRSHGGLPDVDTIAFTLRIDPKDANRLLGKLVAARFVDAADDGHRIHDWKRWRGGKLDPTAAERKRHERDRKRSHPVTPVTNVTLGHAHVTRDKRDVTPCHGGHDCHATYIHTEQDIQNTPQPPKGGDGVGDSRDSDPAPVPAPPPGVAAPGSPAWQAVVDSLPSEWGPQGQAACVRLLAAFPPAVVAYGMEKLLDRFDGGFPGGAGGWWRTVCHSNPDGRPKAKFGKPAPPNPVLKFSVPVPEDIYPPAKLAKMREAGRA